MATYPTDATISSTGFNTIATTSYSSTGSETVFDLPSNVTYAAEVIATIDGIVQDTASYTVGPRGNTIIFFDAPNATSLYLKTIDLPERFRVLRKYPAAFYVNYSNTSLTSVNGNSYLLNGVATTFSLPLAACGVTNSANNMFVTISGVLQNTGSFTYPSATLGNDGIDLSGAPANSEIDVAYANATMEIRVLIPEVQSLGSFTSMADRKPDTGYTTNKEFKTYSYEAQAGYEKRRLASRRPRRSYSLTYSNISGIEKQAIEDFYTARAGDYETFTFDLSHINDSGTVRVRFDGSLDISHVASRGANLVDNFYIVTFDLREDFN